MIVRTRVVKSTPWLFERVQVAVMVGGLLLLIVLVGLGMS